MNHGKLYIISAPSGAGKTSLVRQLIIDMPGVAVSVSHTTRAQRPGECDGRDYFFIDTEAFNAMSEHGDFLEHAQVFDNFYGTAKRTVEEKLKAGIDVILEIDWQGAQQIKRQLPECVSIFILPPSTAVLEQRLRNRGQDNEGIIARRMRDAVAEISHYYEYDYLVVNDIFDEALSALKSIVFANRLHMERQRRALAPLLENLLTG
ncbi:MAG: guanylate kinase [Gammaproteobacteria bacterium]